jgi:hypothetical protein
VVLIRHVVPSAEEFVKMARGYDNGGKYRGGKSSEERGGRNDDRDSKCHDSRKSHDTERRGAGGKRDR